MIGTLSCSAPRRCPGLLVVTVRGRTPEALHGWMAARPPGAAKLAEPDFAGHLVSAMSSCCDCGAKLPPSQVPVEDELVHVDIALPDYKASTCRLCMALPGFATGDLGRGLEQRLGRCWRSLARASAAASTAAAAAASAAAQPWHTLHVSTQHACPFPCIHGIPAPACL